MAGGATSTATTNRDERAYPAGSRLSRQAGSISDKQFLFLSPTRNWLSQLAHCCLRRIEHEAELELLGPFHRSFALEHFLRILVRPQRQPEPHASSHRILPAMRQPVSCMSNCLESVVGFSGAGRMRTRD